MTDALVLSLTPGAIAGLKAVASLMLALVLLWLFDR
jgi:hypothetical protein